MTAEKLIRALEGTDPTPRVALDDGLVVLTLAGPGREVRLDPGSALELAIDLCDAAGRADARALAELKGGAPCPRP
jgi:hypothetical protein